MTAAKEEGTATRFERSPIDAAPKDGHAVFGFLLMRWLPYKAASEQYRKGIKGRWQEWNGYGWENAREQPGEWLKPLTDEESRT